MPYGRKRARANLMVHVYAKKRAKQSRRRVPHGPGKAGVGNGSGGRLMPQLRPPPITKLERSLDHLGVPVQRFRQFRQEERVNVTPTSGHCAWYCVPVTMEMGNPMTVFDYNTLAEPYKTERLLIKQTPNSCDLFDIYRNLISGVGKDSAYNIDTRQAFGLTGLGVSGSLGNLYIGGPFGTQDTTTVGLASQIPPGIRIMKPGMDYTARTHITYDNVSTLDAFVEVYRLVYKPRRFAHPGTNDYEIGNDFTPQATLWRNLLNGTQFVWKHVAAVNPGTQYCSVTDVAKYPHPNYGGGLLKAYAECVRFQRAGSYASGTTTASISQISSTEQGFDRTVDLQPAAEGSTLNSRGKGDFQNPDTYDQILCHPKVDPLKCCPPRRNTSSLGFTMERVQTARRIKPGSSMRFNIPSTGTRHWSYMDSPQGRKNQEDAPFTMTPCGYSVVYCFRVWGDMIHRKTDTAGEGETDFQTGSTSVTFDTQRVIWARVRPRNYTVTNPTLLPFDADVAIGEQEQINDEDDKPMIVDNAGS